MDEQWIYSLTKVAVESQEAGIMTPASATVCRKKSRLHTIQEGIQSDIRIYVN